MVGPRTAAKVTLTLLTLTHSLGRRSAKPHRGRKIENFRYWAFKHHFTLQKCILKYLVTYVQTAMVWGLLQWILFRKMYYFDFLVMYLFLISTRSMIFSNSFLSWNARSSLENWRYFRPQIWFKIDNHEFEASWLRPTSRKWARMELDFDLDLNHVSIVQTSFHERIIHLDTILYI